MNIRVHFKSGKHLDFELTNFSSVNSFYRSMNWKLETILLCGVIVLINDISYIEEIPKKIKLSKDFKVRL